MLCAPIQSQNRSIYYRSTSHGFIGGFEERQIQEWYREGFFYSDLEFRFEGRTGTYTLDQLRTLNGIACPFSFVNTTKSNSDSTSSSDSGIDLSILSSLMEMVPSLPEEPPLKQQQIILTSRLTNEEAFHFANDVRVRMEDETRSVICTMNNRETSCFFYSSFGPREEHIYDKNETWRVKGLLSAKNVSLLAIIADRQHIFSLLSSLNEASKQNKLPSLTYILLICTGSIEFYWDIRSISRFLERRRFIRNHINDRSCRRFIKLSR